ncbi:MAG: YifB family Mg chelatase-like AAA ATPase [Candidatus Paceibacterota bacterium]|jgi:magnesium chelatase family protein
MSFSRVLSAQTNYLDAAIIKVETDLSKGLNSFSIVGLPDKAVEEARDRISAAIKNSGFLSPKQKNQRTVVALAPAELKKEGANFDLAIALGYLLATKLIRFNPEKRLFLGELSLDGKLQPIAGSLALVSEAKKRGIEEVYLPKQNATEGALISDIKIFGADNLLEIIAHLIEKSLDKTDESPRILKFELEVTPPTQVIYEEPERGLDLSDIKGQESAKRGLLISAAGGHNLAMYGPPGTGKTMLARAFTHLLPSLSFEEALEVTAIHSVSGTLKETLVTRPPLRSPHHTSSYVAIVGGGTVPKPGEITLAHRGVLFLDEFPEFERRVIDGLRQPLEDRVVSVSRIKGTAQFPAQFILIAAMNPCPCGNFGISGKPCICSASNIERYKRKISGPIIDRIDLWVEVSSVDHESLTSREKSGADTKTVRKQIAEAREIQAKRFKDSKRPIKTNGEMSAKDVIELIDLAKEVKDEFNKSAKKLDLSARSYHRVLKLARTIADLEKSDAVEREHIFEALQYRPKQRM